MTFLSSRTKVRDLLLYALLAGDSSFHFVPFRMTIMSFRARATARRGISYKYLLGRRFFKAKPFRMTAYCNFFPAAKKLPRKVARSLSGIPAFRFDRRRGLRNSLRSNSPRPFSVFSLAPGSPIKAGMLRPMKLIALHIGDASLSLSMTPKCHSE